MKTGTNVNTVEYRNEFSKRLVDLVKEKKSDLDIKSDEAFCEKVGLSYDTYKGWKTTYKTDKFVKECARYPKYDSLVFLADLFEVSIDYLTLRTDEKTPHHEKLNADIKTVSEYLKLNERVVVHLASPYTNSDIVHTFINYLLDIDSKTEKILRKKLTNLLSDNKNGEYLSKLNDELNKHFEENKQKDNIYFYKKELVANLIKFIMNSGEKITDFHERKVHDLLLKNKFGMTEDFIKADKDLFEAYYFLNITKYLNDIKKHYFKTEYLENERKSKEEFDKWADETFGKPLDNVTLVLDEEEGLDKMKLVIDTKKKK